MFPFLFYFQMVTRTKKIFVGGLSAPTTLEDVKSYFEQFGPVSLHNYIYVDFVSMKFIPLMLCATRPLARVWNIPRMPLTFYTCKSSKLKLTVEGFILCSRSLWNAERTQPRVVILRWWNKSFVFLMTAHLILMIRKEMEVVKYEVEEKFQFFIKIHEIQYEINLHQ